MTGMKQLHKSVLEHLGAVYPRFSFSRQKPF